MIPCCDLYNSHKTPPCQGVTPSNSKGGLPAPEARAHAQEGGIDGQVDSAPSWLEGLRDKAESLEKSQTRRPH